MDNDKIRFSSVEVLYFWFLFKHTCNENDIAGLKEFLKEAKLDIELPETLTRKNFHYFFNSVVDKFFEQYGAVFIKIIKEFIESEEFTNMQDKFKICEER